MKQKDKFLGVRISPELYAELEKRAKKERRTVSMTVRIAIENYLKEKKNDEV